MKHNISMELAFKDQPLDAFLLVYGGYLPINGAVRKAILAAGWLPQQFPPTPYPSNVLEDYLQTEEYNQPEGTGIFGSHTREEGCRNLRALRKNLKVLGIKLGKSRQMTIQELL